MILKEEGKEEKLLGKIINCYDCKKKGKRKNICRKEKKSFTFS